MVGLHSYMDMLQVKFDVGLNSFIEPTIGDKSVETLYLNRVTSENKRICTPPLSPTFKVGVFVVFCWQLEQGHNIVRRGGDGGGKLCFLLLKLIKRKNAQFWAKCLNSFCRRLQLKTPVTNIAKIAKITCNKIPDLKS